MDTLKDQIDYYRARAGEYDEWFYRGGRYDQGPDLNQRWFDEVQICRQSLLSIGSVDTALELAAGTGIWTSELLKIAAHVTSIDASPEVLEINRHKQGASASVTFEQADLFTWEPSRQFNLVSFTFWLSHVPPAIVKEFLAKVYRATEPGGTVFMVDSLRASTGTVTKASERGADIRQRRVLNDGRTFEIVKIYYEAEKLAGLFQDAGFTAQAKETPTYFVYVVAKR